MSMPTVALAPDAFMSHQYGHDASILSKIYQKDINITIWKRQLERCIIQAANHILQIKPQLQLSAVINPGDTNDILGNELGCNHNIVPLSKNISELVGMFCCLFDLDRVGLRLTALDHAMCPRFHVDKVPCRLITTYQGAATQWLPHHLVDRRKLGRGNDGKPDEESGIFEKESDTKQLNIGDVALLKGESWNDNQGAGLVHRSPKVSSSHDHRLLLTLDFID